MTAKPMQVLRGTTVRFLGEQDGPPERELKTELAVLFGGQSRVARAYLARIGYPDLDERIVHVALGIRMVPEAEDPAIAEAVAAVFARLFNAQEHLDIVFLTEAKEREVAAVCRPFFEAPPAS